MTKNTPPDTAPLPRWAETVRRKYIGGEASMFVLHHNVFDEILYAGKYYSLVDFLAQVLLAANKQTILVYDPSAGARYAKRSASTGASEKPLAADKPAEEALAAIEQEILLRNSAALIVPYAGSLAPPGDESMLSHADRMAAIRLHRWSMSPELESKDNVVFLLAESLVELHPRIVSNPRVAAVEVPLPDLEERMAVIRQVDPSIDSVHVTRLAGTCTSTRAGRSRLIRSNRSTI